jgi:transcriptional adapter 2-alpha
MPGRLEFEHEVDNDAELVVKDFEFGLVYKYGGDEQPEATVTQSTSEDEPEDDDEGEQAGQNGIGDEAKTENVKVKEEPVDPPAEPCTIKRSASISPKKEMTEGKGKEKAEDPGFEMEDEDELEVKLALLDIYFSKLDKREEAKDLIFERGLTEYKKVRQTLRQSTGTLTGQIQALERKRPKEEKEMLQRYKVFAKLQTAQDFEVMVEGLICEPIIHLCSKLTRR